MWECNWLLMQYILFFPHSHVFQCCHSICHQSHYLCGNRAQHFILAMQTKVGNHQQPRELSPAELVTAAHGPQYRDVYKVWICWVKTRVTCLADGLEGGENRKHSNVGLQDVVLEWFSRLDQFWMNGVTLVIFLGLYEGFYNFFLMMWGRSLEGA